jgi:AraC-like DNA-binding protein
MGGERNQAETKHWARNTTLGHLLRLAEALSTDPAVVIGAVGIDASLANREGAFIPAEQIVDAVEWMAADTQRRDFGLLIAGRVDHRLFGPLGLLLEQCRSLAELHTMLDRFLPLHNSALRIGVSHAPKETIVRFEHDAHGIFEPRHFMEATLLIYARICRLILGAGWSPQAVCLAHDRMARDADYRRAFRAPMRFNQPLNAVVMNDRDFKRVVRVPDPELKTQLEAYLGNLRQTRSRDIVHKIAELVRALLPAEAVTIERVAALLATSKRSLQRRLALQGTSYGEILTDTRAAMAQECLRNQHMSATEVAALLGYSQLSALSRFTRKRLGRSPRQLSAGPAKRRAPARTGR